MLGSHSRNSVFLCIRDSMEITFHVSNFGDFLNNSLSNFIEELASLCRGTTPLTYTTCYWCGSREDTIPRWIVRSRNSLRCQTPCRIFSLQIAIVKWSFLGGAFSESAHAISQISVLSTHTWYRLVSLVATNHTSLGMHQTWIIRAAFKSNQKQYGQELIPPTWIFSLFNGHPM